MFLLRFIQILIRGLVNKHSMKRSGADRSFSLELVRKAIHIIVGILIVLTAQNGILTPSLLGVLTFALAVMVFYNYQYEKELITRLLSVNRADARIPGLDILSFFFGSWLVLILFSGTNPNIAYASIMVLAFADPVAHLISTGFGGKRGAVTKSSYLEGTIAGTIVGALAAWVYVGIIPALLASAVAMFVEAGELRIANHYIDDNFTIPVVAGIVLWVIYVIF